MARHLLPGQAPGVEDARVLRRALLDRRDQRIVLSDAEREDGRGLGGGRVAEVRERLGDKLGPLLFQLPPNFKKAPDRLAETLASLPDGLRAAFEFRHESWFDDEVYALLRARNVALCIADTEEGATPAIATADFGYLRLRAVEYTDDALRRWIETIDTVGAGWHDAYVFFKHEDTGSGPALARRFLALRAGATQLA